MENKTTMNCATANAYDMVDYLAQLGFYPHPKKSKADEAWFNSPLNPPDTDPSFKINLQKNTWFDFISWEGGTLVDFGKLYHKCKTTEEFLEIFAKILPSFPTPVKLHSPGSAIVKSRSEIISVEPIRSLSLIKYLEETRMIDLEVAGQYCQEVNYRIGEKTFYGVGFKNNSGGWAIRNPYMKSAVQPVDFTTIDRGYKKVTAFEGYTNFLTYATIYKGRPEMKSNFCIWNSLGMFTRARAFMDLHETKDLYLDNGVGGDNYTTKALELKLGYRDRRSLYEGYEDMNKWHTETRKQLVHKLRKGLHR